jgi:N,N'-diacetyllegionaminate synthase
MKFGPFDQKIVVGSKIVGLRRPSFLIGEISSNHNLSLPVAKKMIDVAVDAGLDAVKFQHLRYEEQYFPEARNRRFRKIHRRIDFSDRFFRQAFAYAKRRGILCLSTATYPEAVSELQRLGVAAFKVGSAITVGNTHLVGQMAKTGKPVILSTGFCRQADLDRTLSVVSRVKNRKCILLHCVSSYPVPPEALALGHMEELRRRYGCLVGFSDHSQSTCIPAISAALGACIIEKHYTLSRRMKGPDHTFSLEPDELKRMVGNIRAIEAAMKGKRKLLPIERKGRAFYMAKVVAARNIRKGTVVTLRHLKFLRAEGGIHEYDAEHFVIGRRAKRDIPVMRLVTHADFE